MEIKLDAKCIKWLEGNIVNACRGLNWKPDKDTIQHCLLNIWRACLRCGVEHVIGDRALRNVVVRRGIIQEIEKRTGKNGCRLKVKWFRLDYSPKDNRPLLYFASSACKPIDILIDRENVENILRKVRSVLGPTGESILERIVAGDSHAEIRAAVGKSQQTIGWHRRRMKDAVKSIVV